MYQDALSELKKNSL